MHSRKGFFLFIPVLIFLVSISLPDRAVAQGKTLSTGELTGQSEVIVVGKVNNLKAEWNNDKSRIQTTVTIAVDEAMKGSVEGNSLTVVVPGGEVDGVGEWYSHSVVFRPEEEVVVFAAKDKTGKYRVTAGEKGKFLVGKDAATGSKIIKNVGTLEEFTTQVKKNVKDQQSVKKEG